LFDAALSYLFLALNQNMITAVPAFVDYFFPELREDDPVAFPEFVIVINAHSNQTPKRLIDLAALR